jgi:hypothetical protein
MVGTIEEKTLQHVHDSIRHYSFCEFQSFHFHFKLSFSSHISKHKLCMMPVSNIFHTLGENLFWNHWGKTHCKHVHDWIRHYIFCKFQSCYCHLKMSLWSQISKQNVCTVPVRNMFSYFGGKLILEPLRKNTLQACTWLNKALHFFVNFSPVMATWKCHNEVKFLNKICVRCLYATCFSFFGGKMILEPLKEKHYKHVHDWIRHYIFCKFQSCHFHLKMS